MPAKRSLVTQRLLGSFFENLEPLPAYLERILPDNAKVHLDQVFVPPLNTTSSLAKGLERLQNSLVGSRINDGNYPWDLKTSWSVPTSEEVQMGGNLSELVQQAQMRLFRGGAGSRAPSNMLTLGYREADDRLAGLRDIRMMGSMAITNFYVNSHVSDIVLSLEWQHLLEQLGPGVILYLFTEVALFQPVPGSSGNLMQLLGPTLADLPELTRNSKDGAEIPKHTGVKRKRSRHRSANTAIDITPLSQPPRIPKPRVKTLVDRSKSDSVLALGLLKRKLTLPQLKPIKPPVQQRKLTEIQLVRNRIFYARPLRSKSGKVAAGLPLVHIFNRSTPKEVLLKREKRRASPWMNKTKLASYTIDGKTLEARSRKVLKYIWPKEHGLHNVLTSKLDRSRTSEKWQDYTNREDAITSRGAMRTPKRLKAASRLISIMLSKHDRLDYAKLLHYCCPSSLPSSRLTAAERQEIAVDLSENEHQVVTAASQAYTQPFSIAVNSYPASQGQSSSRAHHKPAFTKYKVATGSVSRFAQAVVRQIFPIELLGSHHNLRVLLKNIDTFVRLRRHETLTLHHLSHGFQLLDCHWLLPRNKRALYQRPNASEIQKRQSLLHELLYYIFDSFLIPLLRTNFYATESAAYRNRTVFFRQDDWNSITQPILEKLKQGCFTTISKNEAVGIMSGRQFGYSYVRLLPKLNGVRPIVNLRRRSIKVDRHHGEAAGTQIVQQQQSINNILNVTFHVLKYEKKCNVESMGSSVFGAQDIYDRMYEFKSRLMKKYKGHLPPLYFVKADVVCAFDSIDQKKLLEIVQDIICHDRYVIQRFCQIMSKGDRAAKTWPRLACAEVDQESFSTTMRDHSKDYTNAIFSDGVIYSHCDRSRLIWLLEEHINNNLIKVGKDFCKQKVGIPQGSSLSTLLCCYYLARMEKTRGLIADGDDESLLMRYTDDFLFISTSQEKAKNFYETIQSGDDLFNVKVSMEKSLHNLEVGVGDERCRLVAPTTTLQDTEWMFPWCSYLINIRSLSIQYDINRYRGISLSDTLTISPKNLMGSLAKVIQSSIRNRNLPIYLDVNFNGLDVVVGNLYRNFLLTALKFVSCYRQIRRIHHTHRLGINTGCLRERSNEDAYIHKVVIDSILVCFASAQAKMKRSCSSSLSIDESTASWPIDRYVYHYLALHAFARIFSQRPSSRKWAHPLQRQLRSSAQYQKAHHLHHQHITKAWESCKSVIASITL